MSKSGFTLGHGYNQVNSEIPKSPIKFEICELIELQQSTVGAEFWIYPLLLLHNLLFSSSSDMACSVAGITSDANVLTRQLRLIAQKYVMFQIFPDMQYYCDICGRTAH